MQPDNRIVRITDKVSNELYSKEFTFKHIFYKSTKQKRIFDECINPVVQIVLKGYNAGVIV